MKAMIAVDTLCAYPDHNFSFKIYTDASDYQMGAVIMQNNKMIACWSRKLTGVQKNYGTIEKEMLSIVYYFCEFKIMLLSADKTVYTDHENLTFRTLNVDRVLRWRLTIDQ